MTKKQIKIGIAVIMLATMFGSAFRTRAYPPFLQRAQKFGAKDCLFCHTHPEGGEGWNERGQWLIAEKERRKAEAVDVDWLADYKEAEKEKEKDKEKDKDKEKEKPKDPAKEKP